MSCYPRIALGATRPGDSQLVAWALLAALRQSGMDVRHLSSRSAFARCDAARVATGWASRHLDSWLMTRTECRQSFLQVAGEADLSVIEGSFATPTAPEPEIGGSLERLCELLSLPRVVVVSAEELAQCRLPQYVERPDAILIDAGGAATPLAARTNLEALLGAPVIGQLRLASDLREELSRIPQTGTLTREQSNRLGQAALVHFDLPRLLALACRPLPAGFRLGACELVPWRSKCRVAVAYDDVFSRYFPTVLEKLECLGAEIIAFSPLRDEALPEDCDIVYLGDGQPENFAGDLAANHCMTMALRQYVALGGRLYAEGGGLAYLCRSFETARGVRWPGVGIFAGLASHGAAAAEPRPVEYQWNRATWLAAAGSTVRGYRDGTWRVRFDDPAGGGLAQDQGAHEFGLRHQAIGSLVSLDFSIGSRWLHHFFEPYPACGELVRS